LSRFERGPLCSLSVATAQSSDSMLAMIASVSTATMNTPHSVGSLSCVNASVSGRSTRLTSIFATRETAVPVTTATKGAGIARRPAQGSFFQSMSTAIVTTPRMAAAGLKAPRRAGRASRLARGELAGAPPSSTCNWASAMEIPMPASMPWTTEGAMTSVPRATLR
jgi:hypothetical protein